MPAAGVLHLLRPVCTALVLSLGLGDSGEAVWQLEAVCLNPTALHMHHAGLCALAQCPPLLSHGSSNGGPGWQCMGAPRGGWHATKPSKGPAQQQLSALMLW